MDIGFGTVLGIGVAVGIIGGIVAILTIGDLRDKIIRGFWQSPEWLQYAVGVVVLLGLIAILSWAWFC